MHLENGQKLLVVDDEPDIRELIRDHLRRDFNEVGEAGNVQQALDYCHNQNVAAVITDIRMPGGNGIDLLRQLRSNNNSVPVIVLSAFSDHGLEDIHELGGMALLRKPLDLNVITEVVRKAVSPLDVVPSLPNETIDGGKYLIAPENGNAVWLPGRGGIFIAGEFPRLTSREITFRLPIEAPELSRFEGRGIVTWQRQGSPHHDDGIGVEFTLLTKPSHEWLKKELEQKGPSQYIPSGKA